MVHSASALTDPLVFDCFYRPQVWGGRGLTTHLNRRLPKEGPYGEAWDLSPQPLHVSSVIEGPHCGRDINELWANCHADLTGKSANGVFPLLIKWLECHEMLSLQVHPDDQMAQRLLNQPYGKSEAWIVIDAQPGARVFAGLKENVTRADVEAHIKQGTLAECLHSFVPRPGDCISLPAGTIHAAGGGLLVAEVQQSSDATFRLFDWNRVGLDGKPRELHVARALEATNWNQGPVLPVIPVAVPSGSTAVKVEKLVEGNGFRLERYLAEESFSLPHAGEMTIWMVLEGGGFLNNSATGYQRLFAKGDTVVVPASANEVSWEIVNPPGKLTLLCVRLSGSAI